MSLVEGLTAAGSLIQGIGGAVAGRKNKQALYGQAREELNTATAEERLLRADARKAIGAQLAAQFGNGLTGGSGSAIDAIRESEINAALDAAELRRKGVSRYASLRKQGRMAQTQGYTELAASMIGAGTDLARMRSDWAQARKGTSANSSGWDKSSSKGAG